MMVAPPAAIERRATSHGTPASGTIAGGIERTPERGTPVPPEGEDQEKDRRGRQATGVPDVPGHGECNDSVRHRAKGRRRGAGRTDRQRAGDHHNRAAGANSAKPRKPSASSLPVSSYTKRPSTVVWAKFDIDVASVRRAGRQLGSGRSRARRGQRPRTAAPVRHCPVRKRSQRCLGRRNSTLRSGPLCQRGLTVGVARTPKLGATHNKLAPCTARLADVSGLRGSSVHATRAFS